MPARRLEVVVLAARGLSSSVNEGERCRREVEVAIVCPFDSTGEKFGCKTSQWTLPGKTSKQVWFGRSGIRAFFPLEGPHAPDIVSDKRFQESAELRIRLYASGMSTESNAYLFAKSFLPRELAQSATKQLDRATAQLEAETRISLEDLLNTVPDAFHSGWKTVPRTSIALDMNKLEIWLQVFVLPDHEKLIPQLDTEYQELGSTAPGFRPALCTWGKPPPPEETEAKPEAGFGLQAAPKAKGKAKAKAKPKAAPEAAPEVSREATLKAAPKAAPTAAPTAAPKAASLQQVVVPPGVKPGEFFCVHGQAQEHKVICPQGMKAGDSWQVLSPTTSQLLMVVVPPNIQPGQVFIVQEQVRQQARCPEGASPGDTVSLCPVAPVNNSVLQVVCPTDKKAGDTMEVYAPQSGNWMHVQVPVGIQAGEKFAIQVSEMRPSQSLLPVATPLPPGSVLSPGTPPAVLLQEALPRRDLLGDPSTPNRSVMAHPSTASAPYPAGAATAPAEAPAAAPASLRDPGIDEPLVDMSAAQLPSDFVDFVKEQVTEVDVDEHREQRGLKCQLFVADAVPKEAEPFTANNGFNPSALDLEGLYAESVEDLSQPPRPHPTSPGKVTTQADKFAALSDVSPGGTNPSWADEATQPGSLQALQNQALADFNMSSPKRKNAKGEIERFI